MIEIQTIEKFDEAINSGKLVLADFWATWCGPCRMLLPVLEDILEEAHDFEILKINVDDAAEIAERYDIQSVPTLILFKNGEEIASRSGFLSKSAILQWIEENS